MSFFEDASLVYIPAAVRNGKTYSIKPTDGTGDLTFTRASSATRVGPNGYIEKVRENVTLYSQEFQNSSGWFSIDINVTANAATAPDGTTTADKLVPNTDNSAKMIYNPYGNLASVGEYSLSVYVKAAGYSKVGLRESQSVGFYATFDLSNGTIIDSDTNQVNTITSVGDGWYRITSTRSYTGNISIGILPLDDSYTSGQPFGYSYIGDGTSGILAWGAQTEHGVPTEYIKTEAAAVSVGPVSGTPRLDYLGSDCGRLLLEPARTNLAIHNEAFSNAAWVKTNVNVTSNAAISPDGYQNADAIVEDTASSSGRRVLPFDPFNGTANTYYTFSVYVKKIPNQPTRHIYWMCQNSSNAVYAHFNMTNFSVNEVTISGTGSNASASITSVGNDWYRISLSGIVANIDAEYYNQFYFEDSVRTGFSPQSYTGNGTSGFYLWGWQIEASRYPSSLIPTLGTAVTRVADAAYNTGISSLIGQTAGAFFIDVDIANATSANGNWHILMVGTQGERITIYSTGANIAVDGVGAGGGFLAINGTLALGRNKIAVAYASNDIAFYINGTLMGTRTTASIPNSMGQVDVGGNYIYSNYIAANKYNQLLFFKTRVPNAQLAELTSL